MTMFKDFIKLNKLGSVIIAVLLGLFTILNIAFFSIYGIVTNSIHPVSQKWGSILQLLSTATRMMVVIIGAAMFIVAMITFIGKSRTLLLTHRGRSYYLKIQLLIITVSSFIVSVLFLISNGVEALNLSHMSFEYNIPNIVFINTKEVILIISIFCSYIAVYYLVMYAIDIFANSVNRYQSIAKRNVDLLMFLVRSWLIGWCSVMLFLSPEAVYEVYGNPATKLVTLDTLFIKEFGVFVIVMLMVVVIVDYMCYFKKKVIV